MPDSTTSALLSARECPARPYVMLQRWERLAFLHWRWDPQILQRTLPPGLTVDTFQDSAWLAIVPFFMRGIRPRFCPPVLGISDFLELNVRTYVRDEKGRHGVWFYSLDCDQPLAVWAARTFFHLPYQHARMSARVSGQQVNYHCHRRGQSDESRFSWSLGNLIHHAQPGTLEFFLTERYLLHSKTSHGLRCGQVHHAPYPLAEVQLSSWDANPLIQAGFEDPKRPPDHLTGSLGVNVRIYALTS